MENQEETPAVNYVVQPSNSTVTIEVPENQIPHLTTSEDKQPSLESVVTTVGSTTEPLIEKVICGVCNEQFVEKEKWEEHFKIHPLPESKTAPVVVAEETTPPDTEQANGSVTEGVMQGEVVEEKKKHAGGRPTKYNEEMLQIAKDYYDLCRGKKDGKKRMPFIEELAMECDVDGGTIVNWCDENEEFFTTYKKIMNLQKLRNIQQGYGAKNPTFSIFMLKANHGMMETEKRVLTGERQSDPLQLSVTNYRDANKEIPAETVAQMDQIAE